MATFNAFNLDRQDLARGIHNFSSGGGTFSIMLTNTAPAAANHVYADVSGTELANGGGYTTGGSTSAMSDAIFTTVNERVFGTNVTWTASGGGMGPFRYCIIYNSAATTPYLKPLFAWYDYGSSLTLNSGDTFTVAFDGTNGFFTIT